MKSKHLISIIIFLIVINFLLIYKNCLVKRHMEEINRNFRKSLISIKTVPNFTLSDLKGKKYESKRIIKDSPFTLLVFFSPTDCISCLHEKELWKIISEKIRGIKIVGIARHINKRELTNWVENAELKFPILYDKESEITKSFGINRTPLKVLTDSKGKILLIDKVRITNSEQENFIKELNKIVKER